MGFSHDADITVGAQIDTSQAEKSAQGLTEKLGDAMDKGASKAGKASALISMGMNAISVAAGTALAKIGAQAVQMVSTVVSTGLEFNRQMENYQLAFENLLGDAQAAGDALDAIKADAAKTPFDVAGLVSANRLLISTGQSAEEARQVINALGNAVSASGGGNEELQRMAANLQQIANVGQAAAVDIKQFAYAGIDIYGLLADYTGLARDEVQQLTISYDLLAEALKAASAEGGRYAGAMEAYSQTLQGQMDTLADNAAQLAGALTEGLFEAQKDLVAAAAGWIDTLSTTLETEGPGAMMAAGVQIVFEFAQGAISALPQVVNTAVQTVTDFITGVIQNLPAVANSGGQMIGSLIAGLLGMMVNLEAAVAQIVLAIIDFFLSGDFIDVGIQIISGIIQGFVDALPNLVNTVISAVGNLVENAKQVARDGWNAIQSILSGEAVQDAGAAIDAAATPYHRGSVKNDDYWKQLGDHFQTTDQDQKDGDYRTAAEKAAASTYAFSTALDTLSASGAKAAQQTETLADKTEKAMAGLGDSFVYTGSAAQEQASRLAVLEAAYDTAQTNVGKYKQLLDDSIASSGAASEMSQYLAQQLEQEENAVESAKKALDAYRDSLDTAKQAARQLEAAQEQLADTWNSGYLKKLQSLAADVLGGNLENALLDAGEIAWQKLDIATRQQLVNLAQSWADTLETAFAQDGFAGLAAAGKTIAESLVAGLQDTSSVTGALLDNVLGQVGISGGVEGLLSTIAELAPLVLGVAAAAAAVSAGVAGVASAFAYTVEQSQALQAKVQELTADGQALTAGLSAALDVLQPFLEQSSEMLAQLDQLTALISDTIAGIGIEIMETMVPIIQQILSTLLPVLLALQPALEATGDLLRTLLGLFGSLVTSALTALQPILMALGPLLETLALLLNTIASIVSALLSPALQALGELLNWLLQPVLWVAQAINAAVRLVVSLINSLLRFLGFKVIDLPDGSASRKGQAANTITSASPTKADTQTDLSADLPDYTANTDALEENTAALEENTELIRNPPRYQTGGGGPTTGVTDYSAMLAAARAAVQLQNTRAVTNYQAGSGQTTARLNASWHGESTTVLELDGKEIARATAPYMDEELAF